MISVAGDEPVAVVVATEAPPSVSRGGVGSFGQARVKLRRLDADERT
jgi:hypothetical protein